MSDPKCILDRSIVNNDTLLSMDNFAFSFFAPLCGRNRGAFVLDPPDSHTYGCLHLPEDIAKLAGTKLPHHITIEKTDDINQYTQNGTIPTETTVDLLDFLVQRVYGSSADVNMSPYACEVSGLATLDCPGKRDLGKPIRAVALLGVLTSKGNDWFGTLSADDARDFYTPSDFKQMRKLGLNAVQIPTDLSVFDDKGDQYDLLKALVSMAADEDLDTILVLGGDVPDVDGAVTAAASYAAGHSAIRALTVPSMDAVDVARAAAPDLTLFVPANTGNLTTIELPDNVFPALEMSHIGTVADVASSTSVEDRMKLYFHESSACVERSPIEYMTCWRDLPVFVASGFDLANDDCINMGTPTFKDYGQCDRFDETVGSGWWTRHRLSFASRQLFAYEQGLGWSFAAWKLAGDDEPGVLDRPAKLLALRDVAAAGLFPSIDNITLACLNPPVSDFELGDRTLAPTPSPTTVPDCGNGWWNFTSKQCDYWIPPPPPTPAPTRVCPVCEECQTPAPVVVNDFNWTKAAEAAGVGAAAMLLLVLVLWKLVFARRRHQYESIPN